MTYVISLSCHDVLSERLVRKFELVTLVTGFEGLFAEKHVFLLASIYTYIYD